MLNSKSFIIFLIIVVSIAACNNDQQKKQQKKSNLSFNKLSKQERNNYHRLADIFYAKNLQFTLSGGILVAKNGEIVFEKYNGYSNWLTQEKMDANTSIHIASVSKTFTAVAILKMVQENKLSLQDSVQKFFPNFPYKGVTVKLLLSHRSGLPNYLYFMDTAWKTNTFIQNKDVLNYLIDKQPQLTHRPIGYFIIAIPIMFY
jgi:CubicO group peptidase (beta-lactamase class C family)